MKKIGLILTALMLAASVIFTPVPVNASGTNETDSLINELIELYRDKQENASEEIAQTIAELKEIDSEYGAVWEEIMDYWSYANTEMEVLLNDGPTDLPTDDSVCIVVLGLKLNDDGTMQDELIGRLETGLAIANAYPNSFIAVTGGGTAENNPDATEGQLMGAWLIEQGMDESRVIVEDNAPDTVGNAENTYAILKEKYPQVNSIVLVTSDYHVPRGCLLFQSKFILDAYEKGEEPIRIISSVGYETGKKGYESFELQAKGLTTVAKSSTYVEADNNNTSDSRPYTAVTIIAALVLVTGFFVGKVYLRKR